MSGIALVFLALVCVIIAEIKELNDERNDERVEKLKNDIAMIDDAVERHSKLTDLFGNRAAGEIADIEKRRVEILVGRKLAENWQKS